MGLIPCAKSGSKIEEWQPNLSRSSLYGSCLYRQKQAARQGRLRALVFWQGGGDGKDEKRAESWGENFERMVTAWRTDIGDPKLPVILLVLKQADQTLRNYPYRDVVRQQQLSLQVPYLTKIETIWSRLLSRRHSPDDVGAASGRSGHCNGSPRALKASLIGPQVDGRLFRFRICRHGR